MKDKILESFDFSLNLRIKSAAIIGDDGKIYSAPRPARHHNIIAMMRTDGYIGSVSGHRQGFLLNDGSFVNREIGKIIAKNAGQIISGRTKSQILTSEDMW